MNQLTGDKDFKDEKFINSSLSELEAIINENKMSYIPHNDFEFISFIQKHFESNCQISSAKQMISIINLNGIISSIKSNLLTFLLELAEEIGEKENLNTTDQEKITDSFFNRLGHITIGNNNNFGEITPTVNNDNTINGGIASKINVETNINSSKIETVKEEKKWYKKIFPFLFSLIKPILSFFGIIS